MTNAFGYLVSFSAAIGGLLFGYEIGVVSQVLGMDSFQDYFGILGNEEGRAQFDGNVTFIFLFGCVIGTSDYCMLK